MINLFRAGYTLAFYKAKSLEFCSFMMCSITLYLSFQLTLMISAIHVNEIAKNARRVMQGLSCKLSRKDAGSPKLNIDLMQDHSLSLWKIYVLERSLVVTSLGTLFTYGILLGTLGEKT
ncbi:hypothetical protein AVEN_175908-1 [Araneus ventricosus]|uniref:Gustatory receptor n=1 Tax=Araneus ventricosus TaxID=182803 RepID=A0A4Y2EFA8_ARAVE|nr:hypothetical protein AVEN_175908-1 [Araneus ventricosus]